MRERVKRTVGLSVLCFLFSIMMLGFIGAGVLYSKTEIRYLNTYPNLTFIAEGNIILRDRPRGNFDPIGYSPQQIGIIRVGQSDIKVTRVQSIAYGMSLYARVAFIDGDGQKITGWIYWGKHYLRVV